MLLGAAGSGVGCVHCNPCSVRAMHAASHVLLAGGRTAGWVLLVLLISVKRVL